MKIIHDDPPMPEEIENGFYPRFENGWRHAEVVGRCLMVVFIAGCVGGLLGPGLFSERHAQNHDASLAADYDAVVRAGAPTTIKLETRVPPGGDQVAVTMSRDLVDDLGLSSITPAPQRWQAGNHNVRITFPVVAGQKRAFILLSGSPSFHGGHKFWVHLDAGETLSWSQFGVP